MSTGPAANFSRRDVLRGLGAVLATSLAGCAPARIVLGSYPSAYKHDDELNDRLLRAFVVTVVPGIPVDTPDLARAFGDPFYPLAKCKGFFTSDLARRASKLWHTSAFDRLTLAQRTRVVQDGLDADAVTRKVYRGAITLAQAATYGGIYTASGDVALIDFDGFHGELDPASSTYPDPRRFLATAMTLNGNPA